MNAIGLTFEVVQWVAVAALGVLLLGLLHQMGEVRRRLGPDPGPLVPNEGLALEREAPALVAPEARTGRTVQLSD